MGEHERSRCGMLARDRASIALRLRPRKLFLKKARDAAPQRST